MPAAKPETPEPLPWELPGWLTRRLSELAYTILGIPAIFLFGTLGYAIWRIELHGGADPALGFIGQMLAVAAGLYGVQKVGGKAVTAWQAANTFLDPKDRERLRRLRQGDEDSGRD